MKDNINNLFFMILTVLLVSSFLLGIALFTSAGLRYFQICKINNSIENYMSDMLNYASMHNGFNDPVNSSYTFQQVEQEKLAEYHLTEYISGDIVYYPARGVEALNRSEEVYIEITPLYPSLNPVSNTLRIGNKKTTKGVTHGYVKSHSKDKSHIIDDSVIDVQ